MSGMEPCRSIPIDDVPHPGVDPPLSKLPPPPPPPRYTVPLEETEPALIEALQRLCDSYGVAGVRDTLNQIVDAGWAT